MNKTLAMRDALLERVEAMGSDENIFVTADFASSLGQNSCNFPDRYVNVGIAEQNLINISSGLSLEVQFSHTPSHHLSQCVALSSYASTLR